MNELEIIDLAVSVEGKQILKGLNLKVRQGEVHVLMGPNGSGKSTLSYALMGHPKYKVDRGDILLNGESILNLSPDQRARKGLFLAFQYPTEISGVTLSNFLWTAYRTLHENGGNVTDKTKDLVSFLKFQKIMKEKMGILKIDEKFANRYLNDGFSGGEKKRGEILQLAIMQPKITILDETDSGLDVDALRIVADGIKTLCSSEVGTLLITHYQRILKYIRPDFVNVMVDGKIVASGGEKLAEELEAKGYDWVKNL